MQGNNNFIQRRRSFYSSSTNDDRLPSTIVRSQSSSSKTNKRYSLQYSSSFNNRTVNNTTVSRSATLNEGSLSTTKSSSSLQTSTTACKQYFSGSVLNELTSNKFLIQTKVSGGTKVENKFLIQEASGQQVNKNDILHNIQINDGVSKRDEHPLPCGFSDNQSANEIIQQKKIYNLTSSTIQGNKPNLCKPPAPLVPSKKNISQLKINETANAQSTSFIEGKANLNTSNNCFDSKREASALNNVLSSTTDSIQKVNEIKESQNEFFGTDNEKKRTQKCLKNNINYTKKFDPIIEVNKVGPATSLPKNMLFDSNIKEGDKDLYLKSVNRSLSKEMNEDNLPAEATTSGDKLSHDFKDIHLNSNSVASLKALTQNVEGQLDKHDTANLNSSNSHSKRNNNNVTLINKNVSNDQDKLNVHSFQEEIKTSIKPVLLKWHRMVESSRQEDNSESAIKSEPKIGTSFSIKNTLSPSYVRLNSLPDKIKTKAHTNVSQDISENSRCEAKYESVQNALSSQFSINKKLDKTFNAEETLPTHFHTLSKTSYARANSLPSKMQSKVVDHSNIATGYELPFEGFYQAGPSSSYQSGLISSNQRGFTSYQTGPTSSYQLGLRSSNQKGFTSSPQTEITSCQTGPIFSNQSTPNPLTSIDYRVNQMNQVYAKHSSTDSYDHSDLVARQQVNSVKTSTCQMSDISERSMTDTCCTVSQNSYSESVTTSQQTKQKFIDSLPQSLIEGCHISQNDIMVISSELLNSLLMERDVHRTHTSMEESRTLRFQATNELIDDTQYSPSAPPLHMFQNQND